MNTRYIKKNQNSKKITEMQIQNIFIGNNKVNELKFEG
jgi:hypothetical protein